MTGMHIVITGNPVDGFTYIGPFTTSEDALAYAEMLGSGIDWWIAPLQEDYS